MKELDLKIETRRQKTNMPYIDIITEFAKEHEIDIEDVVKELDSSIIDKIKVEFIELNMVKDEKIDTRIEEFIE